MEGAAVRPRVVEGDVLDVNCTDLYVVVQRSLPLKAVVEVFVEDEGGGVIIMEDLGEDRKKKTEALRC